VTRGEFEREFHSRTLAYLPEFRTDPRAVVVLLGDCAHTPSGHALAAALANRLARAHWRLIFVGDLDRGLPCPDPLGAAAVAPTARGLAAVPALTPCN
jgi:hypothetical protein